MSSSCEPLLAALKLCLMRSDCVLKRNTPPSICLKEHADELPEECQHLRKTLFECKRTMLDMRKRFRGNVAGKMAKQLEEEARLRDEGNRYR